jgi:16S rRNA processing protein RimM
LAIKGYEVLEARAAKTVVIVRFKGVNDRNAAEALNGTALYIDRSQLSDDDLEDDEFFQTDLIGLAAIDAEGKSYGVVSAVFDFGGGDLIELSEKGKRPMLIPFTEAAVPEIDFEKGTLLVEPFAAGLIPDENDNPLKSGNQQKKRPKKS